MFNFCLLFAVSCSRIAERISPRFNKLPAPGAGGVCCVASKLPVRFGVLQGERPLAADVKELLTRRLHGASVLIWIAASAQRRKETSMSAAEGKYFVQIRSAWPIFYSWYTVLKCECGKINNLRRKNLAERCLMVPRL